MAKWDIDKPLGRCSGTGEKIETSQEYFAALVETAQGLQRQDFSVDYWQKHRPKVYCYWKTKLQQEGQKRNVFIDDEMLMAFFDRLSEEAEQMNVHFRFVLALVLMRKKKLRYESCRIADGKEVWMLRVAGSKRTADVVNPHIDEQQIEQLSNQIGRILQVEL